MKMKIKKPYHDEWYTRLEDVELLDKVANLKSIITEGKVVRCPCDTEESKIAIYLKHNFPNNTIMDSAYDFRNVKTDENSIVITNPPFHQINDFINYFKNAEVILLIPSNRLTYSTTRRFIKDRLIGSYITHDGPMYFDSGMDCNEPPKKLYCHWIHLKGVKND